MSRVVLDASAVLALLNDEPGADRVAKVLPDSVISAVNLAEVVAKLAEAGMPGDEIREALDPLGLEVVPFEEELAYAAGELRPKTRSLGLSLGDRACLALGVRLGLSVLTTEGAWQKAAVSIPVVVIR